MLVLVKDIYGSDYEPGDEEDDDSESETEDEDGEELTPAMDAAILRTLSKIRSQDPTIYDSSKSVFQGMIDSGTALAVVLI